MLKVIFLLSSCCLISAQLLVTPGVQYDDHHIHDHSAPTPYQFTYSAPAIGGGSTHQETGDGYGRKTGSYTVEDEDGRSRVVEYVADEGGFRAAISTNEPGTANQNPADVSISSSADDGYGGVQAIAAPAPPPAIAVSPVAPVAVVPPAPVRIVPQPTPLRLRRPAYVPIQRVVAPIQPSLFPYQPTLIPTRFNGIYPEPALVRLDNSRILTQPAVIPVGARLINQPSLFEDRRIIARPAVIPFGSRYINQPSLFDDRRFISQPALIPIADPNLIPFRSTLFGAY